MRVNTYANLAHKWCTNSYKNNNQLKKYFYRKSSATWTKRLAKISTAKRKYTQLEFVKQNLN